jgi:hypothetical protein
MSVFVAFKKHHFYGAMDKSSPMRDVVNFISVELAFCNVRINVQSLKRNSFTIVLHWTVFAADNIDNDM